MLFLLAQALADSESLDESLLIRDILSANPDMASAEAAVSEARAMIVNGALWPNPMVDLRVAPFSEMGGWQVEIQQDLPLWGSGRLNRAMAEADADAAEARRAMMSLELTKMAEMEWVDWYMIHRELSLMEKSLSILEALTDSLRARAAAGLATGLDVLQVEAEKGMMLRQIQAGKARRDLVAYALNTLLHRDPHTPLLPPPEKLSLPALSSSSSTRPEAEEAAAMIRAAQARAAMARLDRAPMLGLMAGWDGMEPMIEDRPMIGITIQLPLNQRLIAAREEAALAELQKYKAEQEKVGDALRLEQATAQRRYEAQQESLQILEERILPPLKARVEAAREGYAAGRLELRGLLEAERAVLEAEISHEEAQSMLYLQARLRTLSGAPPQEEAAP